METLNPNVPVFHYAVFERFYLLIAADDAFSGSHAGQCDDDIAALRKKPDIAEQLSALSADAVRAELAEYGAWDAVDLANHDANLARLLWIACGNIRDALTEEER